MNVFNQDPHLPIGVLNLTAKNEPTVIGQCPVCGRDIYEGEWVYRIDGEVVCTNRRCLVDRAPINKYVGDFGYLFDLSKHVGVNIKDILADDSGRYLPRFFTEELISEFVNWCIFKGEIKKERLYEQIQIYKGL